MILAIVVLATGGTYLYYDSKPKEYTASTDLYVQTSPLDRALFGTDSAIDPDRNNTDQAKLLRSRSVAEAVARRLHYQGDPADLQGGIDVRTSTGSDFVTISATQGTPVAAARLANAFATAFIAVRRAATRNDITAARQVAEEELSRLSNNSANADARTTLTARVRRLRVIEGLPTGSAQQVDQALPPGGASAPRPRRNALFALFVSLVFAIGAAFTLDRIDKRVRRVDEVEPVYDLPLLATVGHTRKMAPDAEGKAVLPDNLREAFRTLRTNLELLSLDRPLRKILVTSAVPKEGKSSVVRNLALAYREAGARVAVVEADLRQPTMKSLFHIYAGAGLTNVLTGEHTLATALQPVAAGSESTILTALQAPANYAVGGPESNGGGGPGELVVLTSGEPTANPPAVLASNRLRELLDEIAASHDIVLIDSPPILAVSDAIPLLTAVDGTIVVARLDLSTRSAGRRAMELIRRVPGAQVLGVVANDSHEPSSRYYMYSPS
jgi:Mrp family chromosome partitioning ATPase/capsular polysaccharide biosynthesis protein